MLIHNTIAQNHIDMHMNDVNTAMVVHHGFM